MSTAHFCLGRSSLIFNSSLSNVLVIRVKIHAHFLIKRRKESIVKYSQDRQIYWWIILRLTLCAARAERGTTRPRSGSPLGVIPLTGVPCRHPVRISTQELHPPCSRRPPSNRRRFSQDPSRTPIHVRNVPSVMWNERRHISTGVGYRGRPYLSVVYIINDHEYALRIFIYFREIRADAAATS